VVARNRGPHPDKRLSHTCCCFAAGEKVDSGLRGTVSSLPQITRDWLLSFSEAVCIFLSKRTRKKRSRSLAFDRINLHGAIPVRPCLNPWSPAFLSPWFLLDDHPACKSVSVAFRSNDYCDRLQRLHAGRPIASIIVSMATVRYPRAPRCSPRIVWCPRRCPKIIRQLNGGLWASAGPSNEDTESGPSLCVRVENCPSCD